MSRGARHRQGLFLSACLAVTIAAATAEGQSPAPTATAESQSPAPTATAESQSPPLAENPKTAAQAHFEKGKSLYRAGQRAAALAEFLASRKLYPTRSSTQNAALCLAELSRFDDALDMYEALLRDFADLPDSIRTPATIEIVRLRGLVGTIDVANAELGAAITIDDRPRGTYPPIGPLRVPAGSHVVRVYKQGFEPFEDRVEVAGGTTARVSAPLAALRAEGRLRVAEKNERKLAVVIDGSVVGDTPWEGPLSPGDHTVFLRGEGEDGTQPVSVPVKVGETTPLTLAAEALGGWLRVEPTPAGAGVVIDSVTVGRGVWEGRLRVGPHRVEVLADGFLAAREAVKLERGEPGVVRVSLERDLSSPMWRKPSRLTLEIGAGVPLTATFGGVADACGEGCDRGVGAGGYAVFKGGYELGSGFSFGVAAGYLSVWQSVSNRGARLLPVGRDALDGEASDTLNLKGFLAGAWAGYSLGEAYPVRLRLGAGALLGSASDARSFRWGDRQAGPVGLTRSSTMVVVAPEVRAGIRLGKHAELCAGLEVLVLVSPSAPSWDRGDVPVDADDEGIAYFEGSEIVGSVLVLAAPFLGARYDF